MRLLYFCALSLTALLPGFAQTAANAGPGLPQDPREIFAAAAPFYDFNSPDLKPWHLKATYQLYDEKGKPGEQGTYEYWWASRQVHRSSWTRPAATHTEWLTADNQRPHQDTGEPLKFLEYKLQAALLSPLPSYSDLDPTRSRLVKEFIASNGAEFPCIMVIPLMPQYGDLKTLPLGLFPTYCFDPQLPVLRANHFFGNLTTEFNHIVTVQNMYLARKILVSDGTRRVLSAEVDAITGLDPSDPALIPPVVKPVTKLDKDKNVELVRATFIKKQAPIYPQDAKDAHISGTVVLNITIGTDGGIRDLRVISSPWPSLAASALSAVSHWEYKPYLLNGEPVEVEITANVTYTLGN
jgi:TonB family protein